MINHNDISYILVDIPIEEAQRTSNDFNIYYVPRRCDLPSLKKNDDQLSENKTAVLIVQLSFNCQPWSTRGFYSHRDHVLVITDDIYINIHHYANNIFLIGCYGHEECLKWPPLFQTINGSFFMFRKVPMKVG